MKLRRNLEKKVIILVVILIATCFFQNLQAENSSEFDFSMSLENEELIIKTGDSSTNIITLNLISTNVSENVTLHGEWIGEQPQNISVTISNQSGIPSFSSNITFTSFGIETGSFVYRLTAEGTTVSISNDILINITFNNTLILQTNKVNYTKGERIHLSGNITRNPNNDTVFSNNITITLNNGSWTRYFTTQLQNNSYDCYYNISYGDPKGKWNVSAEIEDKQDGEAICYKYLNITLPSDTVRYKIVWFSPPENAIYQRGATFNISVFVTEDDTGVKNASTNCIMPSLEKINLTEIKQGYYRGSYTLPWDSQIGLWRLTIESTKGTGASLKAGGGNISIEIKPAKLKLNLAEPSLDKYLLGETIEIKVNLSYNDNSNVENANVTAELFSENLTLISQDNKTYAINYTTTSKNEGSWILEIFATDAFGNNASETQIIYIIHEEKFIFPFTTVIGIIATILILVFAVYIFRKRVHLIRSQDVKEEIEEIKRLQNEAANKYYKEGTISRVTYDLLQKEHTERLAELKKGKK